jgi:hypothetical protein
LETACPILSAEVGHPSSGGVPLLGASEAGVSSFGRFSAEVFWQHSLTGLSKAGIPGSNR